MMQIGYGYRKNKIYSYMIYSLSAALFTASIFSYSALLVFSSAILLLLASIYYNSGHIVNNLLLRKSKVIEIYNGYKLSTEGLSLCKRNGNEFVSISAAILTPNNISNITPEDYESVIESVHEPFDLSISIVEEGKSRILEDLNTKLKMKEIELAKIDPGKYDRINSIKRDITVIEGDIEDISSGGKALSVYIILKTRATSANEIDAIVESAKNIERLAESFAASCRLEYNILSGEHLIRALESW